MDALEMRRAEGRKLAEAVRPLAGKDAIVLGISRGGLVVAHEVARILGLPLEALVVHRIAEPSEPHLGVGAVAEPGHIEVSRRRLRALSLDATWLREAVAHGMREVGRRGVRYRGERQRRDLAERQVILIDDSAATGVTLRAAIRAVRAMGAREIIVAIPVAPRHVLERLAPHVECVVCSATPAELIARDSHYPAPLELSDDDLRDLLGLAGPPVEQHLPSGQDRAEP
jgi:putative phosphoribosyl transferase